MEHFPNSNDLIASTGNQCDKQQSHLNEPPLSVKSWSQICEFKEIRDQQNIMISKILASSFLQQPQENASEILKSSCLNNQTVIGAEDEKLSFLTKLNLKKHGSVATHIPKKRRRSAETLTNHPDAQNSSAAKRKVKSEVGMISIGPNNTLIPESFLRSLRWGNPSLVVRKLLEYTFDRETLATHSLSGKPSPAFMDRPMPAKGQLSKTIVEDIIYFVQAQDPNASGKLIRNAITNKCADETKRWRLQMKKQSKQI